MTSRNWLSVSGIDVSIAVTLLRVCFARTQVWACCYPSGHSLFFIPSFLPLFLPTGVASATLGSWISCPRQQTISRLALGRKWEHNWVWERAGKILLWAARSCCVTSLISSKPTWSLFSLSVAERSSSISLLPVLEPLIPNLSWLRAKLIYLHRLRPAIFAPGQLERTGVLLASSRWGGDLFGLWLWLLLCPLTAGVEGTLLEHANAQALENNLACASVI